MTHNVFFSWQLDQEAKACKNLIEWSLNRAINVLATDLEVIEAMRDEDLDLDKDTKGVSGSPPLVDTILKKIAEAEIFIPDLTFVGTRVNGRPTPNPNVLIEYGWALKCHGHTRIIAVMNEAFGKPTRQDMPFDLGHLRFPICFTCPEGADNETRNKARETLAQALKNAIKAILTSAEFATSHAPALPPKHEPIAPAEGRARFKATLEEIGLTQTPLATLLGKPESRVKLSPGGAIWLRLMPDQRQSTHWSFNAMRNALSEAGGGRGLATPLATEAYREFGYVRGADGFGVFAMPFPHQVTTPGLVYLFDSGEIWAIDTYPVQAFQPEKKVLFLEPYFTAALPVYANCLARLGVTKPYRWEAGVEGVESHHLIVPGQPGKLSLEPMIGPFLKNEIYAEGEYSLDKSPADQLRPFFEMLYHGCGKTRPSFLDK